VLRVAVLPFGENALARQKAVVVALHLVLELTPMQPVCQTRMGPPRPRSPQNALSALMMRHGGWLTMGKTALHRIWSIQSATRMPLGLRTIIASSVVTLLAMGMMVMYAALLQPGTFARGLLFELARDSLHEVLT